MQGNYWKFISEPFEARKEMSSILPDVFSRAQAKQSANGVLDSESKTLSDADDDTELSETEIAIRSQVAQLASVDQAAIHLHRPTMFELGLDSIEAMKLAARSRTSDSELHLAHIEISHHCRNCSRGQFEYESQ